MNPIRPARPTRMRKRNCCLLPEQSRMTPRLALRLAMVQCSLFPADDQSEELIQPVVTDEAIPSDAVLPPEQAKRKRTIVIAAVVAVAVIAAAAGAAVWLNSRRDGQELKSSLATCQSAYASYRTATEDLQTALAKGKQMQSVTASQVADAATLSTLKKP